MHFICLETQFHELFAIEILIIFCWTSDFERKDFGIFAKMFIHVCQNCFCSQAKFVEQNKFCLKHYYFAVRYGILSKFLGASAERVIEVLQN